MEQLKKLNEDLTQENKLHLKHLAVLSHEIRNFLNGIICSNEMLEKTSLDKEQTELIEISLHSGRELLCLLNDTLDNAKIKSSHTGIEKTVINIRQFIQEIVFVNEFKFKKKGLAMLLEFSEDVPTFIYGDPSRIRQVLGNLIGNSLKFTHVGEVKVSVKCTKQDSKTCTLLFSVRDTGIGIEKKNLKNIFKAFTQADEHILGKFGGSGLGLNISRDMVASMGGELKVESELGKGTRFKFEIDFGIDVKREESLDISRELSKESIAEKYALKKENEFSGRVLIVDDDETSRFILGKMLEKFGIEYQVAKDGKEAVCLYQKEAFDLIFMDLMMPVMGGDIAVKKIRDLEKNKKDKDKAAIIMLTAAGLSENKKKCLSAGSDEFLTKPIMHEKIRETFENWL